MSELNLSTPDQAEAAFYSAFASGDIEAMMSVWADDADIICIHPHGPRLVGQASIRDAWQQILKHAPRMRFNISEVNTLSSGDLAIHFVNEIIQISGDTEPEFTVMATNIYRRTTYGWRIILHHASPAPEAAAETAGRERDGAEKDRTIH